MKSEITIGGFDHPYRRTTMERALKGLQSAGYRHMGLIGKHGEDVCPRLDASDAEVDSLSRMIADHGLAPAVFYHMELMKAFAGQVLDPSFERLANIAARMGFAHLLSNGTWGWRSFPTEPRSPEGLQRSNDLFCRNVESAIPILERLSLVLMFKPHTGNTADGTACLKLMERIHSKHVRVCYDPGNVHFYEGLDPVADIRACLSHVAGLIAKDHRGSRGNEDFPVPGEGDVDFTGLFRVLKTSSFSGPVLVERIDGDRSAADLSPDEIDRKMKGAREYLERITQDNRLR